MTYRLRNIFIAVGLALVAMMLTLFYVTNYKRSVQHGEAQTEVWVAARDIPAGASGADLVKQHAFKSTQIPRRSVVAGAVSDPEQVAKLVLSQPLYAGEQVTVRRFQDQKAQGIVGQLKGAFRAVSVPGDANQLLAGIVKDGDRVDLVATVSGGNSDSAQATRIVLRDLLVLRAPPAPSGASVDVGAKSALVLRVSDTQVQRLFFVMTTSKWTLELRPVIDPQDSAERLDGWVTVLSEGINATAWNHFVDGNFRSIFNGQ